MKEHPILFNGEMVRALLDGRKTQTRRVFKPHRMFAKRIIEQVIMSSGGANYWIKNYLRTGLLRKCPYGVPGDRLWVRETWAIRDCGAKVSVKAEAWPDCWPIQRLEYPATQKKDHRSNKRPSIFMPRWACRTILEVTDVRVERVQDISEDDAINEGIEKWEVYDGSLTPVRIFRDLWESINAKRGFGWDKNPWVWVVSFKKVK